MSQQGSGGGAQGRPGGVPLALGQGLRRMSKWQWAIGVVAVAAQAALLHATATSDESEARYEEQLEPYRRDLLARIAQEASAGASRRKEPLTVVEIGIGDCERNMTFYQQAAAGPLKDREVRLVGVDPSTYNAKKLDTRVQRDKRFDAWPSNLAFAQELRGAEALPFADSSVDVAVSTLTLCSLHRPMRSVGELHRVLKPGGVLLFLEHVPDADHRGLAMAVLNPLSVMFRKGCRLDRDTEALVRGAGFAEVRVVGEVGARLPGAVGLVARVLGLAEVRHKIGVARK
ncbi:unnamed protein product [Pedinophyceae sp. YPF-701]|nr:unnamed protein product [Pedinophyceae sp. YPF-701]